MLEKTRNKKARTAGLVLLIPSLAERPRTMAELNTLMAEQNVPADRRPALRKAWVAGAAVFYVTSLMRFASRSETFSQEFMMDQFASVMPLIVEDMKACARQLIDGQITLDEFQRRVAAMIESNFWEAAFALFGPSLWLFPAILLLVKQLVEQQLAWLRGLVLDIRFGRQRLDGTLLRRIGLYGSAAWSALLEFSRRLAVIQGYTSEMNVLGMAEHCQGCIDETAKGWVPIGALVPIGQRTCLSNCKCRYVFK